MGEASDSRQLKHERGAWRNGVFAAVLCVLMAGPLALLATQELAGAELPSWLTSEDAIELAGGVADDDVAANLSVAAFQEGTLQNAFRARLPTSLCWAANTTACRSTTPISSRATTTGTRAGLRRLMPR